MNSATLTSPQLPTSSSSSFTIPLIQTNTQIQFKPIKLFPRKLLPISVKCTQTPCSRKSCPRIGRNSSQESSSNVTQKLQCLVTEFKSLTEPIDRVKRLLDYAIRLPSFDESTRSVENRVSGCTAQVWLEVTMELDGFMRFKVDSDSEITKGFCSCLIWLLDGAAPEDVLAVKAEDLAEMNVGILPAKSRVNTWNTVLISMQNRTKALMAERFTRPPNLEGLPCLVGAVSHSTTSVCLCKDV